MNEIEKIREFSQDLKEFANDISNGNYAKQIGHECAQAIMEDIDLIYETAVDDFYHAYNPKYYSRIYSLYDVYRVSADDTGIEWEDPAFYPGGHRVDGEYIYHYSFELGFHGGATAGNGDKKDAAGNTHPGGIVYRSPAPSKGNKPYIFWGSQAVSSSAPSTIAGREIMRYQNGKQNRSGHTLQERFDDAVEYVNLKYDIFNWM